ncbi:MAG: hypothetical protein H6819_06705 [Phycisphaerales bacterium]|nr:hypothetical protein [Phycisphaerales bacterium]MCB9855271.1 hypothetical protein [Phycisphaerales bacterium]MCB9862864.1 hypothetical protein [Phycisphaerales bacterium]
MPTPGEQLGAAFEKIFELVRTQMRAAEDLATLVDEVEMHLFDNDNEEFRDSNPEDAPELGTRIWCVPGRNETDGVWSSGTAQFTRRFEIGIGTDSLDSAYVNKLEGIITVALFQLHHKRTPQGQPLSIDIAPLNLESILIGSVDHEREPILDPEEIQAIAEVTVVATGPIALLAPKA